MRIISGLIVLAATAATATAAMAETSRWSDGEYIKAARCRGIAGSQALGVVDTSALDALLKAQSRGRAPHIVEKADTSRADAERVAKRAGAERKAALIAERDGSCRAYMS